MAESEELVPAKPLNLTDLSYDLRHWNEELQHHTATRNYLFRIVNGEAAPPVFAFDDEKMCSESKPYTVDLAKMPGDVIELLLLTMIDHEEKLAFYAWERIAAVGQQAIEVVKHVKEMRANPPKAQADEDLKPYGLTQGKDNPCKTEDDS